MSIKTLIPASALAALMFTSPAALAQAAGGQAAPVDEATLEKFVEAKQQIQTLQSKFSRKLQSVEDQAKARELQMKAQEQMVAAVEDSGLSVEQYNNLANRMKEDPKLRRRVLESQ